MTLNLSFAFRWNSSKTPKEDLSLFDHFFTSDCLVTQCYAKHMSECFDYDLLLM